MSFGSSDSTRSCVSSFEGESKKTSLRTDEGLTVRD